jgi:hypothetical protein
MRKPVNRDDGLIAFLFALLLIFCILLFKDFTFHYSIDQPMPNLLGPPSCMDLDGDGYGDPMDDSCPQAIRDCDDTHPYINPGATETCTDAKDNDCNAECDYDSQFCPHGDIACPVQLTGISVNETRPIENTFITVSCTATTPNVNSVYVTINATPCPAPPTWQGNVAQFSCNVGGWGVRSIRCNVDTTKSYQIGSSPTTNLNITREPCAPGRICTMAMQYARVGNNDRLNIQNYDYVVTNANGVGINSPTPSIINYVDSTVPVVFYQNFLERVEFTGISCANPWPQITVNEPWFLHDMQEQRLEHLIWTDFFSMDVTNTAYQDFTAQHALNIMNCVPGIDGIFYDNTGEYLSWWWSDINRTTCTIPCRTPEENQPPWPSIGCPSNCPYLTRTQFEDGGVFPIFNKVKTSIGPNRQLTINGLYEGYADYVDNQLYEGWIHSAATSATNYLSKSSLLGQMNWLAGSWFSDEQVMVSTGVNGAATVPENEKVLGFTFASYLLAKRSDSTVYFAYEYRATPDHDYYPQYFELHMGNPVAIYYVVGSGNTDVLARDYDRGKVLANFNNIGAPAANVNLGGTFKKLDGTPVTQVSLTDHEGIVLLKQDYCDMTFACSAGSACCGNTCKALTCENDAQCNDGNSVTRDTCEFPSSCMAKCTYTAIAPPDITPPTISITTPTPSQTVAGVVNILATASDNVAIDRVQFIMDQNTFIGFDFQAPYTASWDTSGVSEGAHTLRPIHAISAHQRHCR